MNKNKMFAVMITFIIAAFGTAFACEGPQCKVETSSAAWSEVGQWSTPYIATSSNQNGEDWAITQGKIGWDLNAASRGNESATAEVFGEGLWKGYTAGAFQHEVMGGELSGSGALSTTTIYANGEADGKDTYNCRKKGDDYAEVDLEIAGSAYQGNAAYSDDNTSYIRGFNDSQVDFWGQTDKTDNGTFLGQESWDTSASVYDSIHGCGITGGGTLVYAKNTGNSAEIYGITGNFATGNLNGAEHSSVDVAGRGEIGGNAILDSTGYAGFNSKFQYKGNDFGAGIAGGAAKLNVSECNGTMRITAYSTGFASAGVGNDIGPR